MKVHQIRTLSCNMHAISSIVVLRLYMKYSKSYRSWQPLKMVIFYNFGNIFVPVLWRHKFTTSQLHLKVAYVPLVEWHKFGNSGPTIREVKMNKVKVNKAKK